MNWFKRKKKLSGDVSVTDFSCVRDGLTLRGKEYRPAGTSLPAAIVSHGFMATHATVTQYTEALAQMGYAAYCFDFNGGSVMGSKSDGKTTEMSVLTEVADLEAVIDYVLSLPYIRPDGLLLMGCSQGGFVSALTAAKRGAQIARLVLFYPALCIPDDARAGKMMMAKFDPQNVPEQFRCGPMRLGRRYVTDVQDMDPFVRISAYAGPVLIVHGTKDEIVAPEYARRALEAYQNRPGSPDGPDGEPLVRLEMIENGAHGFSKSHDVIAIEALRSFAQEACKKG